MEKIPVYQSHIERALRQLDQKAAELTAQHSCRETVQLTSVDKIPGVVGLAGMTLCFMREKPTDEWTLDLNRHIVVDEGYQSAELP